MSWKTRNIRRRNKGKKTKGRKQKGGLGGPSLEDIVKYLIKSPPEDGVPVHMENQGIANSPFLGPFKIKFMGQNKFVIITPPDGFKEGVPVENQYNYSIKGVIKKIEITVSNLTKKAGIDGKIIVIENIKEISNTVNENKKQIEIDKKDALKKSIDDNNVKVEEQKTLDAKNAENAKNEALFRVIQIKNYKFYNKKDDYNDDALNKLYFCIDTHLKLITKDSIIKFLECNQQPPPNSIPKITMTKGEAKAKLELALTKMNFFTDTFRKDDLNNIIKKLNVEEITNGKNN